MSSAARRPNLMGMRNLPPLWTNAHRTNGPEEAYRAVASASGEVLQGRHPARRRFVGGSPTGRDEGEPALRVVAPGEDHPAPALCLGVGDEAVVVTATAGVRETELTDEDGEALARLDPAPQERRSVVRRCRRALRWGLTGTRVGVQGVDDVVAGQRGGRELVAPDVAGDEDEVRRAGA